jgi:hypothetical protein
MLLQKYCDSDSDNTSESKESIFHKNLSIFIYTYTENFLHLSSVLSKNHFQRVWSKSGPTQLLYV